MYLSSLPVLASEFHVSSSEVQLTLSSFFIGFSIGQLIYGPMSDRFGRKKPLYLGLFVFVFASIACAVSSSIESLIFFRVLQALGACSGGVISRAIIRDTFHPDEASKIYSYLVLVFGAAPILAPIIGSYLLLSFGWHSIFITLSLLGALALAAVVFFLDESGQGKQSREHANRSVLEGYLVIAKNSQFISYALIGGFAVAGMFAYIASSSFVFIDYYQFDPEQYSIVFGANALAYIIGAQINARVVGRFKMVQILSLSTLLIALAGMALFINFFFNSNLYVELGALSCFLFAMGFVMPNTMALAMAPFSHNAGSASALLGTIQFGMASISSIALGYESDSAGVSMGIMTMVCGLSSLIVYAMVTKRT